ncbi:MAG: hypothetical protein U0L62_00665 [Paludibacteraceae bacterium]|nr:hypothetical protein [Paludibacteraceae bacterium]MEE0950713.1 hypothetical protein [Paludibacteraceae bacterium]
MRKEILSDRFTGKEKVSLKNRARRVSKATGDAFNMACLIDESKSGKPVQIGLQNLDKVSHTVAIFAGDLHSVDEIKNIAGESVDAIVSHGEFLKNGETPLLVCDCPKLEYIRRYLQRNPTRIDAFQLTTDNELQFANTLKLVEYSPFGGPVSDSITPKTYLTPEQFNRTMVEISNIKHFSLDHAHVFIVTIGAGRTLDMTLMLGSGFDSAAALQDMAEALIG